MPPLLVRCYAELNDGLPPEQRYRDFPVSMPEGSTTHRLLTAIGISPSDVDLIIVDGARASVEQILPEHGRVSIYPVFESFDISPVGALHGSPIRHPRFIADSHLARLARDLRMLGLDARLRTGESDEELLTLAREERRAILTRDRQLLTDPRIERGYLIRSTLPHDQLLEVLHRFDLGTCIAPLTRCLRCNALLEEVPEKSVREQLPERVRPHPGTVRRCPACDRLYWEGTHVARMNRVISGILEELRQIDSEGGAGG